MKRPGQPTELATAYVMLADPLSSYVSGATIAVRAESLSSRKLSHLNFPEKHRLKNRLFGRRTSWKTGGSRAVFDQLAPDLVG